MKIYDLVNEIEGKILCCIDKRDNEFKGVCSSDLLSFVISHAEKDNAIVTVLSNINVLGVAALTEAACVVISSSMEVVESIIQKAEREDIMLISTNLSTYDVCGKIYKLENGW